MAKATPIAVWPATVGIVLPTRGRREDAHNRPLAYDKGVYGGQPDQALDDQQVGALRQGSARQKV